MGEHTLECLRCHEVLPLSAFTKAFKHCDACERSRKRKCTDKQGRMLRAARRNAKKRGMAFHLQKGDITIPERCPYLGCELNFEADGRQWNCPSIDRIDPSMGYVAGNVQVISDLANSMKNSATREQLIAFSRNVLAMECVQ